MLFLIVKLYF